MENEEGVSLWQSYIDRVEIARGLDFRPETAAKVLKICTKSREQDTVFKRYLFWFYAKKANKNLTYKRLGEITGGHDHATVIHGIRLAQDAYFYKQCLKEFEERVLRVIDKTDFSND